ncbi:hypothetical protein SAMN04489707_10632 [Paenacidovorax caeni]|uniref:Uncharacterized protein n=1 Tax=Paenacidovorax caeni TaxID=343013 RepID=A0A1I7KPK4_9BURK|nr:hypothetical protein SAMN04489707_10632 [Paenacidovorax caeni]
MSEVTTRPATRATKAPARQKTAPSTIPISAPSKRTVSEASCAAAEALTYGNFSKPIRSLPDPRSLTRPLP